MRRTCGGPCLLRGVRHIGQGGYRAGARYQLHPQVEERTSELMTRAASNRMAHLTGSFISAVRDACRNGLLDWSPRLMLAMYTCDIQASSG